MGDHDLGEIHALCLEEVQGSGSGLMPGVGVGGDRDAGFAVRDRYRPRDPLDARSQALLLDHALEEGCFDPGVPDAVADVLDEQVCQQLRSLQESAWAAVAEVVGQLVSGPHPLFRRQPWWS